MRVGDIMVVTSVNDRRNGGPRKTSITKVGRKYVSVHGSRTQFDIATGRAHDEYGHEHLWTVDAYEAHQARCEAEKELAAFGLRIEFGKCRAREHLMTIHAALLPVLRTTEALKTGDSNG